MNKEKIKLIIISIIVAFILQFAKMSILESSIVSNLPWLGNILMAFDAVYIFMHANDGFSPEIGQIVVMKFISIVVSFLAAAYIVEFTSVA